MPNQIEQEKSYAESIASDIFNMLASAKAQGLDMTTGFANQPLSTPKVTLRYMFYGKKDLVNVPGTPEALKKKFKKANVLATIIFKGKLVGLHLICAFDKHFHKVQSEAEVLAAIDEKALEDYAEDVRNVLRDDMNEAISPDGPDTTQ